MVKSIYARDTCFSDDCTRANIYSSSISIAITSIKSIGSAFFKDVSIGDDCIAVVCYTSNSCFWS